MSKKYLQIFLVIVLLILFISKILRINTSGIDEDVNVVLTPAKTLVQNGNLVNTGYAFPMQIIRNYSQNPEDIKMPLWISYLGAVLYFYPFIYIFGSGSVVPFLIGQSLLLLIIITLFIYYGSRFNKILENLVLVILFVLSCLDLSLIYSPTQFQFMIIAMIIWFNRDSVEKKSILIGILIGLSFQFRTESIVVLFGLIVYTYFIRSSALKFLKTSTLLVIFFLVTIGIFTIIRNVLGAASSSDSFLVAASPSVLVPNWELLFGTKVYSISDFIKMDALLALIKKVGKEIYFLFSFDHSIYRTSIFSFILFFFLIPIIFFKNLPKSIKKDYSFIIIVSVLLFLFASASISTPRYFELIFLLLFIFILEHFSFYKSIVSDTVKVNTRIIYPVLGFIFITYISIYSFRVLTWTNSEKNYIRSAQEIKKYIKQNERVLIRYPQIWTWYCNGSQAVIFDNTTTFDKKILDVYKPHAIIIRNEINEPIADSIYDKKMIKLIPFDSSYNLLIYR